MPTPGAMEVPGIALDMFRHAFEVQNAYGQEKYHSVLMTHNGRDFGKDLFQELADTVNYAAGLVLEHADALQQIAALKSEVDELRYSLGLDLKYGGGIG